MTVNELLVIMQNRLLALTEARKSSVSAGDLDRIVQIDNDLVTTLTSITQLKKAIELAE